MDTTLYHPGVSDGSVKVLTRVIAGLIPRRKRKYPLELVVRAILHRVDNGCKWRALDRAALPWHVAYDYYRRWASSNVMDRANRLIVRVTRTLVAFAASGRARAEPTAACVDSQSVKSRVWGRRDDRGFDGHKSVNGVKYHLATDTRGYVLACVCGPASAHDSTYVYDVAHAIRWSGWRRVGVAFCDAAYRGATPAAAARRFGIELEVTTLQDAKRLKASGFAPAPKRWVVERTFSNLAWSRAVAQSYERKRDHVEANVLWASMRLCLRQLEKV